jgi:fatty acid-binding protein DegV
LKFLAKSGRINKAQLVLGTVMQMKPITRVNPDGTLESEATVKSFDQAKEMMASIACRRLTNPARTRVAVMHTNAPQLGKFLADTLRAKLAVTPAELNVWEAGPAIAANAGPGAAAIFMVED